MANDLSRRSQRDPHDPKNLLPEAAQKRTNRALHEGSKARRVAELAYRQDDPESQLALDAANFDFAFYVLAVTLHEFRAAGVHGEKLREISLDEIEDAVNSLELGEAHERYLRSLLTLEWDGELDAAGLALPPRRH
jgi:hypothetical protein